MVDQIPRDRKWITRWVLAASLGLNLLFVGAFAGAAYRAAGGPGAPGGEGRALSRGYAAPYVHALPREKRSALVRELRKNNRSKVPNSERARQELYQQMVVVLRTTPFDPTAAEKVLSTQREAVTNMQSTAETMWLAEVAKMSAEERATYADNLEKVLKRGPRKRNHPEKDDG